MSFRRSPLTNPGKRNSLTGPPKKAAAVAVAIVVSLSLLGTSAAPAEDTAPETSTAPVTEVTPEPEETTDPAPAADPEQVADPVTPGSDTVSPPTPTTTPAPEPDVAAAVATGWERLDGIDRYASSVAVSGKYSPGVRVAYIASGETFPDALSAAPAAAVQGGPLLITRASTLPANVSAELVRLQPKLIVVVGGNGAVSDSVYSELSGLAPSIRRDWGSDRYETSRAITAAAFPRGSASTAFVATGNNFPDALTASAAAGGKRIPVILVNGGAESVDQPTAKLLTDIGINRVEIAGGSSVVSDQIETSLRNLTGTAVRHAGADRYLSSNAMNLASFTTAPVAYLAKGTDFPDALSGAALAARERAPLFIVPTECVPWYTLETLKKLGTSKVILLGGTGALDQNVQNLVECTSEISRSGALLGFTQPFALHVNVSGHFGMRIHPIYGTRTMHYGTDYAQSGLSGTRIRAIADGVVVAKNTSYATYGMGNSITILHKDRVRSQTMHMIAPSTFNIGDTVKASQIVGHVGSTGGSTGPHLHFEIRIGTERIDPYLFLKGAQLARIL